VDPRPCPHCQAPIFLTEAACHTCGAFLEQVEVLGGKPELPWENRANLGIWKAGFRTTKGILFRPRTFFSLMNGSRPWEDAGTFLLIFGGAPALLLHVFLGAFLTFRDGVWWRLPVCLAAGLVWLATLALSTLLWGLSIHLSLKPVRSGWRITQSTITYVVAAQTCAWGLLSTLLVAISMHLLAAFDIFAIGYILVLTGIFLGIAVVWTSVCATLAIAKAQDCPLWKAAVAVLWAPALLVGVLLLLAFA